MSTYLTLDVTSPYAYNLPLQVSDCGCGSHACYNCRRTAIDNVALAIVERERRMCDGMQGFDIEAHAWKMAEQYRHNAINELAWEDVNGELI